MCSGDRRNHSMQKGARFSRHVTAGSKLNEPGGRLGDDGRVCLAIGPRFHREPTPSVSQRLRQCSTARDKYFLAVSLDTPS